MTAPHELSWPAEPRWNTARLFEIERARLSELLASLEGPDWDRPSPCPGWTVLGLCSHLVSVDLGFLARRRDGYYGTPGPADASEGEFIAWLDDLQDEWVRAARRLSPRIVADLLGWAGSQAAQTLRGEDPRALTADVSWAGTGPAPVWLDHLRELSEYWIHRQQLLQAVGRPSDLRADLAEPVLDGLRWAYRFRLGPVRAEPGDTVTIAITGPVTLTWHLAATPAGWEYRAAPGPRVVASLALTTEQAWRLLTSNLPAADRAGLAGSGNDAILDVLYQTRAIIGVPK
jgi:uncharacterized protein (TIGR03083 family)